MAVVLKGNDRISGRTVEVTHESIVVRTYLRAPIALASVRAVAGFRGIITTWVVENIIPWDLPEGGDQAWRVVLHTKTDRDGLTGNFISTQSAYEVGNPNSSYGEEIFDKDDIYFSLSNEGTDYGVYDGPPIATGLAKATLSLLRVPEENT